MSADELVPIFWPADLLQGDAVRQALKSEGIACHLEGENLDYGVGFPNLGPNRGMRILVRSLDAGRAKEIIEAGEWPTYT